MLSRLILAVFIFVGIRGGAQDFSSKAKKLIGTFNVYHFNPIALNEKTSSEIVDLFIADLDEQGIFLKKNDVTELEANKKLFLDQIQSGSNDYYESAKNIFLNAINKSDSVFALLEKKTLNYSENDTAHFLTLSAKAFYSPTNAYHAKRLERNVKSRSYERVINAGDYSKLTEGEFNAKANEYAKVIIKNFRDKAKSLKEKHEHLIEAALLNAIAKRYDPHSDYFTQEQNREFNESLSAQIESFGFSLAPDENGNIIIKKIEPGGSAWLSNQLNEGDYFQSVKVGDALLSTADKGIEEIEEKIKTTAEKFIVLTIKKPTGYLKSVKLVKQKINSEENSVKGYVLKGTGINLGYISLPSFYTDMGNTNKPGCANDVAKEILKLEKDSIQGLIIDLRNNGGGSMLEAMNLAGIFIDEGPLFIFKQKNRKPSLVKDVNRGSIFKKPIVVMINEASASASELFSNIVKDYRLGLIVGQTSYGKGTAQEVLPLDTMMLLNKRGMENNKDFIKITNGKFYRLNGSTHQGTGVVPDIMLPGFPAYSTYKESKEKFYIPADSVVKKVVFSPDPEMNISELSKRSAQRMAVSTEFKRYKQSSDSLETFFNTPFSIALKHKDYIKHREKSDKMFTSFENACVTQKPGFKCVNNTFDAKLNTYNDAVSEFNSKIIQSIEKDLFINETFSILTDVTQPPK